MKKRGFALCLAALTAVSLSACSPIQNAYEIPDYSEYVTLGEYQNMDIEVTKVVVDDATVQSQIDTIIKGKGKSEQITDRATQLGDTVNWSYDITIGEDGVAAKKQALLESKCENIKITDRVVEDGDTICLDYVGKIDGEAFQNGSSTGYIYTVGGSFIKDLNNQLIGLECGKEYDLTCVFPENYGKEELNGKTAVFTVTVQYIQGEKDLTNLPEWNDEFVYSITSGQYTSAEEYEKALATIATNYSSEEGSAFLLSEQTTDGFGGELVKAVTGVEPGTEKTVTVAFTSDYTANPELEGINATVKFKVNYISGDTIYPEWNDAFVAEYTDNEYTTTKAYEENIRKTKEEDGKKEQKETAMAKIWSRILDTATFADTLPEEALNTEYERTYNHYKELFTNYAQYYGMTYEEFLASYGSMYYGFSDEESMKTWCKSNAESWLKYIMITYVIANANNIKLPTAEFTAKEEELKETYQYPDIATMEEALTVDYLMEYFMYEKVGEWLYEHSNIIEVDAETETSTATSSTTTEADTTAASTTAEADTTASATTAEAVTTAASDET